MGGLPGGPGAGGLLLCLPGLVGGNISELAGLVPVGLGSSNPAGQPRCGPGESPRPGPPPRQRRPDGPAPRQRHT
jgi:hypothetical protein